MYLFLVAIVVSFFGEGEYRDSKNCFHAAVEGRKIDTLRYLNSKNRNLKHQRTSNGQDHVLTSACEISNLEIVQGRNKFVFTF